MSFTIEEMNYENPEVIKRVAEVFKAAFSNPPWNSARSQEEWDTAMQSLAKLRGKFSGKV